MRHSQEGPSRNEDEYFAKEDAARIKALRDKLDADRKKVEKSTGLNKCPKDGTPLTERLFHHIKVDGCPTCKGMWLDAGEFEMLEHVDRNEIRRFIGSLFGLKP
jgi:uncharacterized protein